MEREKNGKSGDGEDNRTSSASINDSLMDFKSPKMETVAQTVSGKSKIVDDKRAKKSSSKAKASSSGRKKEGSASARQKGKAQPSIESSFFKAANTDKREGHVCPLCTRYFEDAYSGTAHTKSCAAKNNVSTTKLLAAVELQERQTDERLAMGLPAGPLLQPKDKNQRRNRVAPSKNDPDLQLALALSKSLQENQAERELEEALLLAAEHRGDESVAEMTDSQRRRTLKNFGFSTNKPVAQGPMKPRRKKHLGPTILQTRSQESRDRLLTEKIAEILMGNEAITQVCQQKCTGGVNSVKRRPVVLKSRLLNKIHRTTKRLWDSAELSRGVTNFYVEDLGAVVVPVANLQREGSATSSETNLDDKADYPAVSNEHQIEVDNTVPDKMLHSPNNQIKEANDRDDGTKNLYVTDRQYRNTLSIDWANTLNISTMSDVVVLVENNHIWAHKLVLHVRCSEMLLDCQPIDDTKFPHVKEKISWPDVDYLTGLAFLEFVYSGAIVKNEHIFGDDRVASLVRGLARRYRLKNLFEYMRKRKFEIDKRSEELEGRRSGLRSPIIIDLVRGNPEADRRHDNPAVTVEIKKEDSGPSASSPSRKADTVDLTIAKTIDIDARTIEDDKQRIDPQPSDNRSVSSSHGSRSMSPDLFDDTTTEDPTEEAATNSREVNEAIDHVSANENSNLKMLAQLIDEDSLSPSTEVSKSDASPIFVDEKQSEESPKVEKSKEYSSLSPIQLETPKSRIATVSTDTKKIQNRSRTQRLPEKPKSNLSIFIEKVQKINAKSVFDSFAEDETLGEPYDRKRLKNPFNVNNESNKSILDNSREVNTVGGHRMKKKGALSALEEQLLLDHEKKENRIDLTSADESADINDSCLTGASEPEDSSIADNAMSTDDENISIYSKYKKTHKHNNSINKYRSLLIKLTEACAAASEDDDKNDYFTTLNEEAIDLTQETDSEVESSPSSNVGSSNRRRSNKRPLISDSNDSLLSGELCETKEKSSTILNHDNSIISSDDDAEDNVVNVESVNPAHQRTIDQDLSKNVTCPVANSTKYSKNLSTSPEYPDPYPCEMDEEMFTQSLKTRGTLTPSPRRSDASGKSVSGKWKRKFDECRAKDTSFIDDLEKCEEAAQYCGNGKANTAKSLSHSSQYPDLDVFEVDEDIFTEGFGSARISPRITPTPSPKSNVLSSQRKRRSDENKAEHFVNGSKEDHEEEHYSDIGVFEVDDHVFTQSFTSPHVSPRRTLTPLPSYEATNEDDCGRNDFLRVASPIVISSSPDMDLSADRPVTNTEDADKENSFLVAESNVGPLHSRRNTLSPSNLEESSSPKPGPSRRRFSPNCGKVSPSPAKNSLVRWNSMPTSTSNAQNNLKRTRTPTKSLRVASSQGVTPPINYDTMDTPELKLELEKYGIKPQKAHRARQLLTHIYNELHSELPSTDADVALSDDDNDEPPVKKISRNDGLTSDDSEPECFASAVPVIPEEMEFADADIQSNESDDASGKGNVKQAFTELIKDDKELHNKLLIYEPLPLETVHMMLKARGFKCKVNDLMDFLDQECITFQVQQQARRPQGKKARGNKSAATKIKKT